MSDRPSPWFRRVAARPDATSRVLAFHHAGAGAAFYRSWLATLPPSIEGVVALLPGREHRLAESPLHDAERVVAAICAAIEPWLDRPVAFFGHSMGAMLAFEVVRALRAAGAPQPVHLFVSAHRAPHLPHGSPRTADMSQAEFLRWLQVLGGTQPELLANAELMELVLPALRADFAICEGYRYRDEAPLSIPITAYAGQADAMVGPEAVLRWSEHTTARFRGQVFPGDHFFLQPAREQLLSEISATCLEGARAGAAASR